MKITYAVLSRGRAQTLAGATLHSLLSAGVPRYNIELWLDEDEVDEYLANVPPDMYGTISVGPAGTTLMDKRNMIASTVKPGTRMVQCDDDIKGFWYATTRERPIHPLKDLPDLAKWAFTVSEQLGLGLWGFYPICNPYFMRPYATSDLRILTGPCWGITFRGDDTEKLTVDEKEDYQRCVKHAIRDGGVLRLNWATFQTDYYGGKGGMQLYRTSQSVLRGAQTLAALYPHHVTLKRSVSHRGTAEVRLTRGKPVAAPIVTPMPWAKSPIQNS